MLDFDIDSNSLDSGHLRTIHRESEFMSKINLPESRGDRKNYKILIIDDESSNLLYFKNLLSTFDNI